MASNCCVAVLSNSGTELSFLPGGDLPFTQKKTLQTLTGSDAIYRPTVKSPTHQGVLSHSPALYLTHPAA